MYARRKWDKTHEHRLGNSSISMIFYILRNYSDRTLGYYLKGNDKNGNAVIITENGSVRLASMATPDNINAIMTKVKTYTNDEVLHLWIEKGLPCAHIHGLEYKGAHWGMMSQEKA